MNFKKNKKIMLGLLPLVAFAPMSLISCSNNSQQSKEIEVKAKDNPEGVSFLDLHREALTIEVIQNIFDIKNEDLNILKDNCKTEIFLTKDDAEPMSLSEVLLIKPNQQIYVKLTTTNGISIKNNSLGIFSNQINTTKNILEIQQNPKPNSNEISLDEIASMNLNVLKRYFSGPGLGENFQEQILALFLNEQGNIIKIGDIVVNQKIKIRLIGLKNNQINKDNVVTSVELVAKLAKPIDPDKDVELSTGLVVKGEFKNIIEKLNLTKKERMHKLQEEKLSSKLKEVFGSEDISVKILDGSNEETGVLKLQLTGTFVNKKYQNEEIKVSGFTNEFKYFEDESLTIVDAEINKNFYFKNLIIEQNYNALPTTYAMYDIFSQIGSRQTDGRIMELSSILSSLDEYSYSINNKNNNDLTLQIKAKYSLKTKNNNNWVAIPNKSIEKNIITLPSASIEKPTLQDKYNYLASSIQSIVGINKNQFASSYYSDFHFNSKHGMGANLLKYNDKFKETYFQTSDDISIGLESVDFNDNTGELELRANLYDFSKDNHLSSPLATHTKKVNISGFKTISSISPLLTKDKNIGLYSTTKSTTIQNALSKELKKEMNDLANGGTISVSPTKIRYWSDFDGPTLFSKNENSDIGMNINTHLSGEFGVMMMLGKDIKSSNFDTRRSMFYTDYSTKQGFYFESAFFELGTDPKIVITKENANNFTFRQEIKLVITSIGSDQTMIEIPYSIVANIFLNL